VRLSGRRDGVEEGWHVRVLVDEAGRIVDLIVDYDVQVLLGGVFRDVGVGEFLVGGHCVDGRGGFFALRREVDVEGLGDGSVL